MLLKRMMQIAVFPLIFSANTFAADNAAVLGAWKMDLNFQRGGVPVVLTITETDNVLGGTWGSPQGSTPLSDVTFDGETLSFTRQGRQGTARMSLKLKGMTLTGSLTTPRGDLPIVAKKSA